MTVPNFQCNIVNCRRQTL